MEKTYIVSVMYDYDSWMFHYAWAYNAMSHYQARDLAIMHFNTMSKGMLRSVYVSDGVYALIERYDGTSKQTTLTPIGSDVSILGPDSRKHTQ